MAEAIIAAGAWVGSALFGTAAAGAAGTVVVGGVTLTAAGAATATIVSGAIYGAIAGAVVGAATSAIKGGNIVKGALTGAVYGAVGGAVTGAATSFFGGAGGTVGGTAAEGTAGLVASPDPSGMAGMFIEAGTPNVGMQTGAQQTAGNIAGGLINNAATPPAPATTPPPTQNWIERNPTASVLLGNTLGKGAIAMLGPDEAEENRKNRLAVAMENDKLRDSKLIDLSQNFLMTALPTINVADQFTKGFTGAVARRRVA